MKMSGGRVVSQWIVRIGWIEGKIDNVLLDGHILFIVTMLLHIVCDGSCYLFLFSRVTSSSDSWPVKWERNNSLISLDYLWKNIMGNLSYLRWDFVIGNSFFVDWSLTKNLCCWPAATWLAIRKTWYINKRHGFISINYFEADVSSIATVLQ